MSEKDKPKQLWDDCPHPPQVWHTGGCYVCERDKLNARIYLALALNKSNLPDFIPDVLEGMSFADLPEQVKAKLAERLIRRPK